MRNIGSIWANVVLYVIARPTTRREMGRRVGEQVLLPVSIACEDSLEQEARSAQEIVNCRIYEKFGGRL